jgi:two-component system, cell cycle sensor histidine kinase and response regulator CckA
MVENPTYEELAQKVKKLEKSEKKYRQLFETVMVGIYRTGIEDGKFFAANEALAKMLGYESVHTLVKEYVTSEHYVDPERRQELLHRLLEDGKVDGFEIEMKRVDGSHIQIALSARIYPDRGYLEGVIVDITDRKRALAALKESEMKFSKLFQASPVYMTFSTLDDGCFLEVNDAFTKITGYPREEVLGRNPAEIGLLPNPEKMFPLVKLIREHGGFYEEKIEFRTKNGESLSGLFSSEKIQLGGRDCLVNVFIDITERKLASSKLQESEERLKLALDSVSDAVWDWRVDTGEVYFSSRWYTMLGYDPYELPQTFETWRDLLHPDDLINAEQTVSRHLNSAKPFEMEFRMRTKSNEWRWILARGKTVEKDSQGNALRMLGTHMDITERIRSEKDKKALETQLQNAQKMEAIGTLAGGVAHDFNNLLMAIQGHASLMIMGKDSTHPDFDHLKEIEDHVESAAELTRQLLGFARGGKYAVRPTDLNELIEKANRMFGRTRKEIVIRGKYEKNLWTVAVDRGQIEQVLLNFYVNAWQAMPEGGALSIETKNVTLDENFVKPFSVEPGRYTNVSVTDTGVGMDKATQEKMFDPFFTTKEIGRGTGLGLASAYGIIKNHGGFINVCSEKDYGSTFSVYLPASGEEIIEEKKPAGDTLKGSETVLLVDDEVMIIEIAEALFNRLGYNVLTAGSGKEAIEIYERNKALIDVVILDMIMPGMSGGETYDRIKHINPKVKILLSSGYSINGQATEILNRGCNGFIQKPFKIKEVSQKLREILDEI